LTRRRVYNLPFDVLECDGCGERSPLEIPPSQLDDWRAVATDGDVVEAVPELRSLRVGLLHVFIRHTSASLTLNENASPDVRDDFEAFFNAAVPEDARYWTHTIEGPDDMPAHIKASLLGPSLTLPVSGGGLAIGTWQGIYLCEHRDRGGARSLVVTLNGE
jgi:secondary thiamine-phosphate synthase enzyme